MSAAASTPGILDVIRDLRADEPALASLASPSATVEIVQGHSDIWAVVRERGTAGGLALRLISCPGGCVSASVRRTKGEPQGVEVRATSPGGTHAARIDLLAAPQTIVHWRTTMRPKTPIRMPVRSRDLYVLGRGDDPRRAVGRVEAAQRGHNTALVYFALEDPSVGVGLYVQDLTALNDFFSQSGTTPDGVVGGDWPELGMLPSAPVQGGSREADPLAAGSDIVVSKGVLAIGPDRGTDTGASALGFLQLLGAAYPYLDKTAPELHDWPALAARTIHDLATSPKASTTHARHRYIRPYTAAEHPDVMVQAAIAAELRSYEAWSGDALPFATRLISGLPAFYDEDLAVLRRYLPGVSEGKDPDAVDSWYLYHPMISLGRLATQGDRTARTLFEDTLDYCVRVARHFEYTWPIEYKVDDWSIITAAADGEGLGQTDVNGIYAYIMLVAFELTEDTEYLEEATKAIAASVERHFDLIYQANLTAFGAAACVRLWRITSEPVHLSQAYVYIASFLHNCQIWESSLNHARYFHTFFSPTCLQDAKYSAAYETFDSFLALEQALRLGGSDLDPAARLLLSEYCAYALDSTWWAYPENIPPEAIASDPRNGHVDRALAFPVEDVYPSGEQAGQVGQEVYGAGAALAYTVRSFVRHPRAPFVVHCDRRIAHSNTNSDGAWSIDLDVPSTATAQLLLLRRSAGPFPHIRITADGSALRAVKRSTDRLEYAVEGSAELQIHWS